MEFTIKAIPWSDDTRLYSFRCPLCNDPLVGDALSEIMSRIVVEQHMTGHHKILKDSFTIVIKNSEDVF